MTTHLRGPRDGTPIRPRLTLAAAPAMPPGVARAAAQGALQDAPPEARPETHPETRPETRPEAVRRAIAAPAAGGGAAQSASARGPRVITSKALLGAETTLLIEHAGQHYQLRLTRLGKLILTK